MLQLVMLSSSSFLHPPFIFEDQNLHLKNPVFVAVHMLAIAPDASTSHPHDRRIKLGRMFHLKALVLTESILMFAKIRSKFELYQYMIHQVGFGTK